MYERRSGEFYSCAAKQDGLLHRLYANACVSDMCLNQVCEWFCPRAYPEQGQRKVETCY